MVSAIFLMASGAVSACYTFDPMSGALPGGGAAVPLVNNAAENTLYRPGIDRQALMGCDGPGWETFISGMYWNDDVARLERVDVKGNRLRNQYAVCYREGCAALLSNLQQVASHLIASGHREAAEQTGFVDNVAKEILEEYKDPCVVPGEDPNLYVARAQVHCRLWVIDRMPWYTWGAKTMAATTACAATSSRQRVKAANPPPDELCVGE